MAVMGKVAAFLFVLGVLGTSCQGQQLHVKHVPPYVVFQSQESPVSSSDLHNVIGGPLGLSSGKTPMFQSKSVLKRPKANVLITVVTHPGQELSMESVASVPLNWDVPFVDTDQLMDRVQGKFLEKDPLMLDLVSNNQFFDIKTSSSLFQSLPPSFASAKDRLLNPDSILERLASKFSSLNSSLSSDGGLMAEMQMMDDIVAELRKNGQKTDTKIPDLFSFTLTGLKGVSEEHGVGSEQAKEAQDLLTKHIDQITEDLKTHYKGNVMVEVLTVPSVERSHVRKTRSLMQTPPDTPNRNPLNLEIFYDKDFPATFNIVLWLMVILIIAVYLVAYGMWNINPNLESILYRVPQDDLKKLN